MDSRSLLMALEIDPTRRASQKVQTKNNIIEANLRKHLQLLQRQYETNLSQIDHDRLDVRDFLKQLKRCTTDDLPEAKHWLGNRTPSGNRIPRTTRLTFRNQSAPTSAEQEAAAREAELLRQEQAREYEMMGFRSSRGPKPELVQRSMALHKLFSKRNLYAGMGHAWDAWGMTGFNGPIINDLDLDSTSTFKDGVAYDSDGQRVRTPDDGTDENGRSRGRSRRDQETLHKSSNCKPEVRHDCGRPGCSGHQSRDNDDEDFMKDLVVGKHRKKRKKKEPLQERINGFFDRMDVIKKEERRRAAMPSQVELHRKWITLTRGAKAALAESSDEEDHNPLHTL